MPLAQKIDMDAMVDAIALLEKELARNNANFQELIEKGELLVHVETQSRVSRLAAALTFYHHATEVLRGDTVRIQYHRDMRYAADGIVLSIKITNSKVH